MKTINYEWRRSDTDTTKEIQVMTRLPYATPARLGELMRQSGLPENPSNTNAFRMLAHTPAIGGSALRLVLALLTETDLEPRLRELVILRVAQRCDGRYAWIQHASVAAIVGVNDAQIAALERGETPNAIFAVRERTAFAFADKVLDTCCATDDTFVAVREMFSPSKVLELLPLIGYFRMICGVMNSLHVELEPAFGAKILEMVQERSRRTVNPQSIVSVF
jgi:4-carboxymuconolactone decarboxylase